MNLEVVSMDFSALVTSLAGGKVDMIADCISITDERKEQIDFSDPYMEDKTAIMVLRDRLDDSLQKEPAAADDSNHSSVSFFQSVADSFYNNIILEQRYLLILDGLKTTGVISAFSILFGTALGALVCFARMAKRKAVKMVARVYISIVRGIPVLVLLMVIFYVVFAKVDIDPVLVAVLAFGMNFGAYVAEMFRTSIENVDRGQTEAGIAGGFTRAQTFSYIVLPQAVRQVLPVYSGELISLVKMTSVVGYIAVQDLTKASDIIRSRTFDAFFPLIMTAVLYFAVSALVIWLLGRLERRVDPKRKRKAV
jgi:polar amino acid transport system substrate-binding protein